MSNKIDVTMIYAVHSAFRRDLKLFAARVGGESNATSHVRAGWENFKNQLLLHHRVEDSHLFPLFIADALDEQAIERCRHPESRVYLGTHEKFGVRPTTFAEFAVRNAGVFRGETATPA